MTKLLFKNDFIKDEFDKLCDSHLVIIINDIIKNYNEVTVDNVYYEKYTLNILLASDDEILNIISLFKQKNIYILSNKKDYIVYYDNYIKNLLSSKSYLYQKKNKVLMKKNIINQDSNFDLKKYTYYFNINNHCYDINITDYQNSFNEENFLKYILNDNLVDINNINECYSLMVNCNDISNIKLEILNKSNNDILLMNCGALLKYHVTFTENGLSKEVFFKDDSFFEKETLIKKIDEDSVYIKKIGGRYGTKKEN